MEQENYIPESFSIEALQSGDERAFEAVFRIYFKPLRYFARQITNDQEAAADAATESLLKFWDHRQNFDNFQSVRAFLYISTKNACLDHLDAVHRRGSHHEAFANQTDFSENDILDEIYKAEVLQQVYYAIDQLPEKYGKILKLSYIEGLKNKEIAEKLDIPVSTVNTQKARGLDVLKKSLPKHSFLLLLAILP